MSIKQFYAISVMKFLILVMGRLNFILVYILWTAWIKETFCSVVHIISNMFLLCLCTIKVTKATSYTHHIWLYYYIVKDICN